MIDKNIDNDEDNKAIIDIPANISKIKIIVFISIFISIFILDLTVHN